MVVPINSGVCACLYYSSKIIDYLKQKEQQNMKKCSFVGGLLKDVCIIHSKSLEDKKIDLNKCNNLKYTFPTYKKLGPSLRLRFETNLL